MTGATDQTGDLGGKLMQLLIETVPKHSRIAMLGDSTMPGYARGQRAQEIAAKRLGLKLIGETPERRRTLTLRFAKFSRERAEALVVATTPALVHQRQKVDSGRDGAVLADECGHAFADGHS